MTGRIRLALVMAVILLVLIMISVHSNPHRRTTLPERMFLELIGTVQAGASGASRFVESIWLDYFYLVDLRQENLMLHGQMGKLTGELAARQEAEITNRRLTRLLSFTGQYDFPFIGARIVAKDPEPWFETMTIGRGTKDGVRVGMPVIADGGVVGRIVTVSRDYSQVLLVIDYNSAIDAVVRRSRVRGILSGRSEKVCSFNYILKNDDVEKDDIIVTSGMDGIFPKGLNIGSVTRINKSGQDIFMEVDVLPSVDFAAIEEVLVILTEQAPF